MVKLLILFFADFAGGFGPERILVVNFVPVETNRNRQKVAEFLETSRILVRFEKFFFFIIQMQDNFGPALLFICFFQL